MRGKSLSTFYSIILRVLHRYAMQFEKIIFGIIYEKLQFFRCIDLDHTG